MVLINLLILEIKLLQKIIKWCQNYYSFWRNYSQDATKNLYSRISQFIISNLTLYHLEGLYFFAKPSIYADFYLFRRHNVPRHVSGDRSETLYLKRFIGFLNIYFHLHHLIFYQNFPLGGFKKGCILFGVIKLNRDIRYPFRGFVWLYLF